MSNLDQSGGRDQHTKVREPVLYEVLLNRAAEELEREKTARLRSCSDSLVGELGEVFSRLLAEAYKRGVVDGFAQGAAAQTEAQR